MRVATAGDVPAGAVASTAALGRDTEHGEGSGQ